MELKERMYVRIKNKVGYCVIGKIENINDFREPSMKYCIDIQGEDFIFIPEDMIVKASHNIIDLIEVGDIVTTNVIYHGLEKKTYYLKRINNSVELDTLKSYVWHNKRIIKSIVTNEQFESIKYSLEG